MSDAMALARSGFRDGERAARVIDDLSGIPGELVERLALAADPDLALEHVAALAAQVGEERVWEAVADPTTLERLVLVMGTSQALGEFIVRHPEAVDDLSLQIERVIREAGNPARRTFYNKEELQTWLSESLGPRERKRLEEFLTAAEG